MILRGRFAQKKVAAIVASIRITQIAIDVFVIAKKTGQWVVLLRQQQEKINLITTGRLTTSNHAPRVVSSMACIQ